MSHIDQLSKRGNAASLLLFAELPAYDANGGESVDRTLGPSDGILNVRIKGFHTATPSNEEFIGFNHRIGKRRIAHVAFVDGHVDAIIAPDGASRTDFRNLTFLLCNGCEIPANKGDWQTARTAFESDK